MNQLYDLKDIATCYYCDCIFESPVILPCSESICGKHVEEMKFVDYSNEIIKCCFCSDQHQIPKPGFPKDKRTARLIEQEFHKMDFGKVHSKAANLCKEFDEMIKNLENLTNDPENVITEYFNRLTNEIDIRREEIKLIVDSWHDDCIEEIDKYKTECSNKLKKEFTQEKEMIDEFKKTLHLWQKKLLIPELSKNDFSFEKIESNANSVVKILNKTLNELKENILCGNEFKFKSQKIISPNDLGEIKIQKKVFFMFYSFISKICIFGNSRVTET